MLSSPQGHVELPDVLIAKHEANVVTVHCTEEKVLVLHNGKKKSINENHFLYYLSTNQVPLKSMSGSA